MISNNLYRRFGFGFFSDPSRVFLWAAVLFFSGLTAGRLYAVTPMVQYNDLVAGSGEAGFQDGLFASALFRNPCGLAISPDASRLFIADKDNNRIREVLLDEENQVQTLVGTGDAGSKDGDFEEAGFNQPLLLCSAGSQQLLVYDSGSGHFRQLDLSTHQVRTLHPKSSSVGPLLSTPSVDSMAYQPKEGSLYFVRNGGLAKMDLGTQLCSPLTLHNPPLTFSPGPLCYYQDHICVSDRGGLVYKLNPDADASKGVSLTLVGKGEKISAIASAGPSLYALPSAENPNQLWSQVAPAQGAGPLPLMNVWGDILEGQALSYFFNYTNPAFSYPAPGFIADPQDEGRFFMSLPAKNLIVSLRDYRFNERKINNKDGLGDLNADGISDFNYPLKKPPKTFRILIAGDSRSFVIAKDGRWPWGGNRMEILAKRLELLLNTLGSLEDYPVHFQVLALGHPNSWDALTWFSYHLPEVVQKYDVDLCLQALTPDAFAYYVYFEHPILPDGIPSKDIDPEYLLKPLSERAKSDPGSEAFYQACVKEKLGDPEQLSKFGPVHQLVGDKIIRPELMDLEGRAYERTAKKIQDGTTLSGIHRLYYLCFFPLANLGSDDTVPNGPYRDLWKEISEKKKLHFMDLTVPFNVLKTSYFHVEEINNFWHNNYHGHVLNAIVLAHELLRQKLIPTEIMGSPAPPQLLQAGLVK